MGWCDWLILATLAVLSMWFGGALYLRIHHLGLHWTGTDGLFIGDQMQYLGWIRDAAHNLRIGNPFRIESSPQIFVHPGLAISGVLTRLGLSPAWSYFVWKPVAVLGLFFGVRAYVHRLVIGKWARLAALALALFGLSLMQDLHRVGIGNSLSAFYDRVLGLEMWPILYLWGYPFTALAVALIPITLLLAERARTRGAVPWGAAAGALFCSWLQPWQGATLVVVLAVTEMVLSRRSHQRPAWRSGVPLVAGVAPLIYYQLLGHLDSGWHLAGQVNRGAGPTWWLVPFFLVPIVIIALAEFLRPAPNYQDISLRTWLVAAVSLYLISSYSPLGTYPPHFFQGLSIPIAIMTVRVLTGVSPGWRHTVAISALGAILIVCVGVRVVREIGNDTNATVQGQIQTAPVGALAQPFGIEPAEARALDYLDHASTPGGVLSRVYLGQTVPGLTGRRTWVGIGSWTPEFQQRVVMADQLFSGAMSPAQARDFVKGTGARFVLSDCSSKADLGRVLTSMVAHAHHFGCATVYQLR
jgi:hypothetical protein